MLSKKAGEGGFANLLGFAIQFVRVTSGKSYLPVPRLLQPIKW